MPIIRQDTRSHIFQILHHPDQNGASLPVCEHLFAASEMISYESFICLLASVVEILFVFDDAAFKLPEAGNVTINNLPAGRGSLLLRAWCKSEVRANYSGQCRDKWLPVTMAWRIFRLRMEERPEILSVAANILNKQSRTTDKGWSSNLGVGRGANISSL